MVAVIVMTLGRPIEVRDTHLVPLQSLLRYPPGSEECDHLLGQGLQLDLRTDDGLMRLLFLPRG